jgi:hypothetical protein
VGPRIGARFLGPQREGAAFDILADGGTLGGMAAPLSPDHFVAHCQSTGFSLEQAHAWFHELAALASPCQFEPQQLRRTPWLRALAHWHRLFRDAVLAVRTPAQWEEYQQRWYHRDFHGPHVQGLMFFQSGDARRFLFTHWPLLSLGEPEAQFEHRCSGTWPTTTAPHSWEGLDHEVTHPRLLGRLLAALPESALALNGNPSRAQWAHTLRQTGLRSVRVHWSEGAQTHRAVLMQMLLEAQIMLATPLNWTGPVLGLAGATGLELVAGLGQAGSGEIRLDPFATGQTLVVDDWGVMAHEWLHTLDATLARDCQQPCRWMTLGLAEDDPSLPADPPIAAAGDAWWHQVARVQVDVLPADVLERTMAEVREWPERLRRTLGSSPELDTQLKIEAEHMMHGDWSEDTARARWEAWIQVQLPEADADLRWRTAQLFSAEMAWAAQPPLLDGPVWATFLRERATDQGLGPVAPRATRQRYLANPVELMARSFEAAFGPHEGTPTPVWQVTRSAAGMVWPLPAEQAYQREGWQTCLAALQPWWQLRQDTPAPLALRKRKKH